MPDKTGIHATSTAVSAILLRHYQDKSRIDEWTAWWLDLPLLRKGAVFSSIMGLAGLTGAIVGLAIPFLALASGIFFLANQLAVHHEEHRRARGARCVSEVDALTKELDTMMVRFKVIQADLTKTLEQVQIQATTMAKNNTVMTALTGTLHHEEKTLHGTIATVSASASLMQQAQTNVTQAIDGVVGRLKRVDAAIENTTGHLQGLDDAIERFKATSEQMHHTEANLEAISGGLRDLLQQAPNADNTPTPAFSAAIQRSQAALALARGRRPLQQKTGDSNSATARP